MNGLAIWLHDYPQPTSSQCNPTPQAQSAVWLLLLMSGVNKNFRDISNVDIETIRSA
jgi:hypothetical protein